MRVERLPDTFRAPWARWVKIASIGSIGVLLGLASLPFLNLPKGPFRGAPAGLVTGTALAILALSALFTVRGYTLEPGTLRVHRLFWTTDLPLAALESAWASPDAMRGALRLFGNGGLFAITGVYSNRRLGRFRAFATDPANAVVLELRERKVVVTPQDPARFLARLRLAAPRARVAQV